MKLFRRILPLALAAIAQVASDPPLYRTQTIPCPVALPLETAGKTMTCGVLTVPEFVLPPAA